jgi:hypothetical protein
MNNILLGAILTASVIISLFFLRFWRSTGDRFFLFFALSFLIDALSRAFAVGSTHLNDETPGYYVLRLIAYALIVFAILDKNRPRDKDK